MRGNDQRKQLFGLILSAHLLKGVIPESVSREVRAHGRLLKNWRS